MSAELEQEVKVGGGGLLVRSFWARLRAELPPTDPKTIRFE